MFISRCSRLAQPYLVLMQTRGLLSRLQECSGQLRTLLIPVLHAQAVAVDTRGGVATGTIHQRLLNEGPRMNGSISPPIKSPPRLGQLQNAGSKRNTAQPFLTSERRPHYNPHAGYVTYDATFTSLPPLPSLQ